VANTPEEVLTMDKPYDTGGQTTAHAGSNLRLGPIRQRDLRRSLADTLRAQRAALELDEQLAAEQRHDAERRARR
jgi:hypothetical protein